MKKNTSIIFFFFTLLGISEAPLADVTYQVYNKGSESIKIEMRGVGIEYLPAGETIPIHYSHPRKIYEQSFSCWKNALSQGGTSMLCGPTKRQVNVKIHGDCEMAGGSVVEKIECMERDWRKNLPSFSSD